MTARAWWWAATSAALYVLASIAVAVLIVWPVQYYGLLPHAASLAVWAAGWVMVSGLAALACGRLLFRLDLRTSAAAWLVLAAGALLNALVMVSLVDWGTLRYGYWDPEFVGPTGLLWHVIAGTATAGFGVLIAPREIVGPAVLCVLIGASLTALIVATNVQGVSDGIPTESWPLAVALGLSAAYAIGLAAVSTRKLLAGRSRAMTGA